jgi:hypothetical protein
MGTVALGEGCARRAEGRGALGSGRGPRAVGRWAVGRWARAVGVLNALLVTSAEGQHGEDGSRMGCIHHTFMTARAVGGTVYRNSGECLHPRGLLLVAISAIINTLARGTREAIATNSVQDRGVSKMRISRQQLAALVAERRAARTAKALQPTPMRADRAEAVDPARNYQATVASRPICRDVPWQCTDAVYAADKTSEQTLDFSQYFFSDLE